MAEDCRRVLSQVDVNALAASTGHVVVVDGAFDDLVVDVMAETSDRLGRHLTPARLSRGKTLWENHSLRGDKTCWITPQLCKEESMVSTEKLVRGMIKACQPLKGALGFNEYSFQFAYYPGDGTGYTRHKDAFASATDAKKRVLTCLFYLNEWCDGGNLRVFDADDSVEREIEPLRGRLVIFRSDLVEHEVLPSYSSRSAITLWASAEVQPAGKRQLDEAKRLPLPTLDTSTRTNNEKIFVSIASYRDPETQYTIRDLYYQASVPERVHVGVVLQCDRKQDIECFLVDSDIREGKENPSFTKWWATHVHSIEMHWTHATGPCRARHIAQSLWQGERYFLQIDSHMRFRGGWDIYCIDTIECLRSTTSPKPILTTYPLGYTLPDNVPNDTRATVLLPSTFDNNGMLRQKGSIVVNTAKIKKAIPSSLWASGFSFGDSSMLQDVPYDPLLPFLFFGEELSMAARLFTQGYDFFAPPEAVVYHLWTRNYRPNFQEAFETSQRDALREESIMRVKRVLDGEDCGLYGLGRQRTIQEFEHLGGFSLSSKEILPVTVLAKGWDLQVDVDDLFVNTLDSLAQTTTGSVKMDALAIAMDFLKKT